MPGLLGRAACSPFALSMIEGQKRPVVKRLMADLDSIINKLTNLHRRVDAMSIMIDGLRREIMQLLEQSRSIRVESSQFGGLKKWTPLSQNLIKLKTECGWSYEDLEHWANVSRSRIADHINNGRAAYPRTLKKYADAFSKKLGRRITASDLLE